MSFPTRTSLGFSRARGTFALGALSATLLTGCAALTSQTAQQRSVPGAAPSLLAVQAASSEVWLAAADVGLDDGVLTIESASRLSRHASTCATTPEQHARAAMIAASLELRALSAQLAPDARVPTETAQAGSGGPAIGSPSMDSSAADSPAVLAAGNLAPAPRRAVVAVAPPRELVTMTSEPPTDAAPRQAVLARAEMHNEGDRNATQAEEVEPAADAASDAVEIWQVPVREPRVTSRFGPRIDPITGERGRMHRGTDYGHPTGTPVYAPASGRAVLAGYCDRGTGNCIVLEHSNGWRSQYFHLSEVSIRSGEEVRQGQMIGEIGSTGRSTGPHLHFQVGPPGGGAVDPETILGTPVQ